MPCALLIPIDYKLHDVPGTISIPIRSKLLSKHLINNFTVWHKQLKRLLYIKIYISQLVYLSLTLTMLLLQILSTFFMMSLMQPRSQVNLEGVCSFNIFKASLERTGDTSPFSFMFSSWFSPVPVNLSMCFADFLTLRLWSGLSGFLSQEHLSEYELLWTLRLCLFLTVVHPHNGQQVGVTSALPSFSFKDTVLSGTDSGDESLLYMIPLFKIDQI